MLGKLLKYELKSTSRLMGVLYLAVLIVAAIVGFLARGTIWQATQGNAIAVVVSGLIYTCLLYTSPSPRDGLLSRMPSSA